MKGRREEGEVPGKMEEARNKGGILNERGAPGVIYGLHLLVGIGVGAAMGT